MTEPLIFDGLTYIPVKGAAAGSQLSTEYLARLARTNRICDRARQLKREIARRDAAYAAKA